MQSYTDNRLKIYSKENEGLYHTWKFGVERASGDYIMFVDSDDFIDPDLFSTINNCLKDNSYDLIQFGYYIYENSTGKFHERQFNMEEGSYFGEELKAYKPQLISQFDVVDFPGSRWSKVFKASKFKEFLKISIDQINDYEDASVTFPFASLIDSLLVIKKPMYFYRIRNDSISQGAHNIEKCFNDCKHISEYFETIKNTVGFTDEMLDKMYFRNFMTIYIRAIKSKQYKFASIIKSDKRFKALLKQFKPNNKIKGFLLKNSCYRTFNFLRRIKNK